MFASMALIKRLLCSLLKLRWSTVCRTARMSSLTGGRRILSSRKLLSVMMMMIPALPRSPAPWATAMWTLRLRKPRRQRKYENTNGRSKKVCVCLYLYNSFISTFCRKKVAKSKSTVMKASQSKSSCKYFQSFLRWLWEMFGWRSKGQ